MTDLTGKLVVITGGNGGIGKETVASLAKLGAKCVMGCRSKERAEASIAELVARGIDASLLEFLPVDLSSLPSVKSFAGELFSRKYTIDFLILNAGLMVSEDIKTEQGYEWMFGVNHLAHFYLTQLILEHKMIKDDARIIVLSSAAAERGAFEMDKIRGIGSAGGYVGFKIYSNTKLYNALFAEELQRRLRAAGSQIDVFPLHPGFVASEFFAGSNGFFGSIFRGIASLFAISVPEGAKTSVYAVTAPELKGKGCSFLAKSQISPLKTKFAKDTAMQAELWKISEELLNKDYSL